MENASTHHEMDGMMSSDVGPVAVDPPSQSSEHFCRVDGDLACLRHAERHMHEAVFGALSTDPDDF